MMDIENRTYMSREEYASVAVFAYNRADKLENCIKNLEKCPEAAESELLIFCDGPKSDKDRENVEKVQTFAKEYASNPGFKSVNVIAASKNKGLAASIIGGVTDVVNKYGRVIVVEDDLVVEPSFLAYMNGALEYYRDDKKCGSVCAFSYPLKELKNYGKDVYFTRKADCWGWATWSDRWNDAKWADTDFEHYLNDRKLRWEFEGLEAGLDRLMYLQYKGKIDSWAVRWIYYLFQKGQLSVYPTKSRVINDGFDGSGTHISNGFGEGFNSAVISDTVDPSIAADSTKITWEKCELSKELAQKSAKFPRRFLPMYVLETTRYMLKKR